MPRAGATISDGSRRRPQAPAPGPTPGGPEAERRCHMSTTTETAELVSAYYGSWQNGISTFDGSKLKEILAEDLDFEGSIAGKRRGAAGFIVGLQRFVEGLKGPINVQQRVEAG